ncbi:hypothetical protein BsWGS_14676 [Bradybaena similaris]
MSLSSATSRDTPPPGGNQNAKENAQSGLSKITKHSSVTPIRPASHGDATKRKSTSPMHNAFKILSGTTRSPDPLQYVEAGVNQQSSRYSGDTFSVKSKSEDDFEHGDADYYIDLDFDDVDDENVNKIDKLKCEKGYEKFSDKIKDFGGDVKDIHHSETLALPDENAHGDYKRSTFLDEYVYTDVVKHKSSFGNCNKKDDDGSRDLSKQEIDFAYAKSGRMCQVSVSSCDHTAAHDGGHQCSRHLTGAPSAYTHQASNTLHNSEMNTVLPQSNYNRRTTQNAIGSSTRLNNTAYTGDARMKQQDSGSIPSNTDANIISSNNSNDSDFDVLERSEKSDIPDSEIVCFKLNSDCVGKGEDYSNIESPFAENRVTRNKDMTCVNRDNSQPRSETVHDAAVVSLLLKQSADDTVFKCENIDESEVIGFSALAANLEQARVVGIPPEGVEKDIIPNNAITNNQRSETTQKYIMEANVDNGVETKRNFTQRDVAHQKNRTHLYKETNLTQRIQMLDEMASIKDIHRHNKEQIQTRVSKKLVNNKETNKSIPLYSYNHGNKVGNKSTKAHFIVSTPKHLQLEAFKLPKPALLQKSSLTGFTYILNMKAINRLLFGPYSKSVNQISPAATSRKHLTKASTPKGRQTALRRSRQRYNGAKGNTSRQRKEHGSDLDLLLKTSTPRNTSNPLNSDDEMLALNKLTNKEIHNGKAHLKTVSNRDGTTERASNQIDVEIDEMTEKYFVISDTEDLQLPETASDCFEATDVKTAEVNSSVWESNASHIELARELNNIAYNKNDVEYIQTGNTKIGRQNETEGPKTQHLHFGIADVKTWEDDSKKDKTEHDAISTMSNELPTHKNREPSSTELLLEDEVDATNQVSHLLKQTDSGSAETTTFRDLSGNTSPIKSHYDPTDSERKPSNLPADVTNLNTTPTSENNPTSPNKQAAVQNCKQSGRITDTLRHSSSSLKSATISPGSPKSASVDKHSENTSVNGKSAISISIDERSTFGIVNNSSHLVALEDELLTSLTSPKHSPNNSPRQSLDSVSRKSVDFRIKNVTKVVLPSMDEEPKAASSSDESFIRNAIPFLPLPLAVCCLVLNVVIPGSGTAMSGLFVLCCGQPRLLRKDDQILTTMCVNCMVGLAQLFTVSFFLVGWFWSVVWGVRMVLLSVQHRNEARDL